MFCRVQASDLISELHFMSQSTMSNLKVLEICLAAAQSSFVWSVLGNKDIYVHSWWDFGVVRVDLNTFQLLTFFHEIHVRVCKSF